MSDENAGDQEVVEEQVEEAPAPEPEPEAPAEEQSVAVGSCEDAWQIASAAGATGSFAAGAERAGGVRLVTDTGQRWFVSSDGRAEKELG